MVRFQRDKMSGRDKATNQLKEYVKKRGPGVSKNCIYVVQAVLSR